MKMRVDSSILLALGCLLGDAMAQNTDGGGDTTATTTTSTKSMNGPEVPTSTSASIAPPAASPLTLEESQWTYEQWAGDTDGPVWPLNLKDIEIRWETNGDATVRTVKLLADGEGDPIAQGDVPASTGGGAGIGRNNILSSGKRDEPGDKGDEKNTLELTVSSTSASIPTDQHENFANQTNKVLYLQFEWAQLGYSGLYYSPAMVLASDESAPAMNSAWNVISVEVPLPEATTSTSSLPSPTPTSSASQESPTEGSSESGGDGNSSGNSGLSTGAIAGIAVACGVVGIALIGLGVWFCLKKRRSAQRSDKVRDMSYGSDAGNNVMMAEKDVPGISESSPHSAYADDGGRLHDRSGTGFSSHDHQQHMAGYAPYSDQAPLGGGIPQQEQQTPHTEASVPTVRSPSPPLASRYAHLVEEGMTEDEIRRLEEEERHLDAAIQEAGERRNR